MHANRPLLAACAAFILGIGLMGLGAAMDSPTEPPMTGDDMGISGHGYASDSLPSTIAK